MKCQSNDRHTPKKKKKKYAHYLIPVEIALNIFYCKFDEKEREGVREIEQIERANFLVVDITACVAVVILCRVYTISTAYRFMGRFKR